MNSTKFLCTYFSADHNRVSLLSFVAYSVVYALMVMWVISNVVGSYHIVNASMYSLDPRTLPFADTLCMMVSVLGFVLATMLIVAGVYDDENDNKYVLFLSPVIFGILYIISKFVRLILHVLSSITISECKREK